MRKARSLLRVMLGVGLMFVVSVGPIGNSWAEPDAERVALEREAVELRARLARLAEEVQALKKADRSVRDDYRLRERMAESEALGRRLTETEARLRAANGASGTLPAGSAQVVAPPIVLPSDGPRELSAKADILFDQAARLMREAERLEKQVARAETRDTLRRGMRRVESDPFIAIEAQNRNLIFSARPRSDSGVRSNQGTRDSMEDGYSTLVPLAPPSSNSNSVPQASATASPPAAPSGESSGDRSAPPSTTTQPSFTGGDAVTGHGVVSAPSVPPQFRMLLDQQTLDEVRRLERLGTPAARAQALRIAIAVLKARAEALNVEASQLRQPTRTAP